MAGSSQPLSEPPEGVVVGDSIPRENEEVGVEVSKVEKLAHKLKEKPGYRDKSDKELKEKAKEMLD